MYIIYLERKVQWLCNTIFPRPDIVQVPQQDEEDDAGDDVGAPDVQQGEVVDGCVDCVPGHPRRSVCVFEPNHDDTKLKAKVGNQ